MPPLIPPSTEALRKVIEGARPLDPGIGVIDTISGRVVLALASDLNGGDHASLVKQMFGITDHQRALHLRGFVVGFEDGRWSIGNCSGLNPFRNRMESDLFDALESMLMPLLGATQ